MKQIIVVGLDEVHLEQLRTLPDAQDYRFKALLTAEEIKQQPQFPVEWLLHEGVAQLQHARDPIDAVIGYWDFPVSTVLPILRNAVGLPGPSLEAVLGCEHKYWSRRLQAEVAPEHVPPFCAVDPFADDPLAQVRIDYPFWLKPIKAVLSNLGFRIDDAGDFDAAIARIRAEIQRWGAPFNLILDQAKLPEAIAAVDGYQCIAESLISAGRQVTQEGWSFGGEVEIYGTMDSLRTGPGASCFERYQYSSQLPAAVLERMSAISRRVIRHIGYDGAPFNIEYFWDQDQDQIWLLEINARLSKSHAPLFRMVDGCYHHQVMVDLGLGRRPRFQRGHGDFRLAAKFMLRQFNDAIVKRVPSADEIAQIEATLPGTEITISVEPGQRLSDLRDQDSYSYEVAVIFIGGNDEAELEAKLANCKRRLPLELEAIAGRQAQPEQTKTNSDRITTARRQQRRSVSKPSEPVH
ncbi:D-alanine--D-alanine ligase [Lamprobacter modestohalophilus]|uniref:D-alanine--D-alanine ligase n=1 Tax=Lamprobacter modestohalophilus TaxID=1064514 RepID=A0A9X0WD50_9GAMM|nr:D-alanine--D-alanine ligase [Lamprobacter modestohalophilus]